MASFVEDLWSSVFTPGPTPTLLIATNVTFAMLQLVLFLLLLATYSIHFVVLSLLCGGLWYSINWFATEVRLAQQTQDAERKKQQPAPDNPRLDASAKSSKKTSAVDSADSETETETLASGATIPRSSAIATGSASSARLQPVGRDAHKRPSMSGDSSGYGSTDSEWEKVDT